MKYNDVVFVGDPHSSFKELFERINTYHNTCFIVLGDSNIGMNIKTDQVNALFSYLEYFNNRNKELEEKGNMLYIMRGNHCNPAFFEKELVKFSNLKTVKDYSIININEQNFLFIGGGISLNRKDLALDMTYWIDEKVVFKDDVLRDLRNIDFVCTHTTPNFCKPLGINSDIVRHYCSLDSKLYIELLEERYLITRIFDILNQNNKIKGHFYGHFHYSFQEKINETMHVLLNIMEFRSLNEIFPY